MRILFLMNDEGSPPGVLGEETRRLSHEASVLVPYKGISHDPSLPGNVPTSADGFDGLVVLGGAMSILDEADYPFVDETRNLFHAFDAAGKPVMGVCFGAQLLADAHGGRVRKLGHTEWGFLSQNWLSAHEEDLLLEGSQPDLPLMQWHGDTFDLPHGATPLSTRPDCPGQAFRIGDINWGFQFHLEMDQPTLMKWADLRADELNCDRELVRSEMREAIALHHDNQARFARTVMERWLAVCEREKGAA
jgi:GMP synthase (glutamine-hydrolysing)